MVRAVRRQGRLHARLADHRRHARHVADRRGVPVSVRHHARFVALRRRWRSACWRTSSPRCSSRARCSRSRSDATCRSVVSTAEHRQLAAVRQHAGQLHALALARAGPVARHHRRGHGDGRRPRAARWASTSPAARWWSWSSQQDGVTEEQVRAAVSVLPGDAVVQRYGAPADRQFLIRLPLASSGADGLEGTVATDRAGAAACGPARVHVRRSASS